MESPIPLNSRPSSSRIRKNLNEPILHNILEARKRVLFGDFGGLWDNEDGLMAWKRYTWLINALVSSTFTDTGLERDFLMNELSPQLRRLGRSHGIDFTFVDMRWGVRDENTMEHMTWLACCQEIERCRSMSIDIFFMSLQVLKLVCSARLSKLALSLVFGPQLFRFNELNVLNFIGFIIQISLTNMVIVPCRNISQNVHLRTVSHCWTGIHSSSHW